MNVTSLGAKSELDLSIVIPALNEADNLATLIPEIWRIIDSLDIHSEIFVVDENADEQTIHVTKNSSATLLCPKTHGYGMALLYGISQARGEYCISMDADFSHPPVFIRDLWNERKHADIIIASRYVPGGQAIMPLSRYLLSRILNAFFGYGLGIPVRDISSGYRLYRAGSVKAQDIEGKDFEILQEILVRAIVAGKKIHEIPFSYHPRERGSSHARVIKFGMAYLRTFFHLRRLRQSKS